MINGYICDGVEFIGTELLEKIRIKSRMYRSFGIGVLSDEFFEKVYGRKPLKTYSERARLASCIRNVDFVFKVDGDNIDINNIEEENFFSVEASSQKPYCLVYTPGTFDLLHEGHLEHLLQCRSVGRILVVGVKSDKNVFETKGKKTHQSEQERLSIIKNIKFVDYAILVTSRNKRNANHIIEKLTGARIDVVMLGSDCKGQEEIENPDGLPFIFTERDPEIAKKRSSTFYREQIEKQCCSELIDV